MLLLARDKKSSVLQVGSYLTTGYENVASGGSKTFTTDTIIRLAAIDADAWISRETNEGTGAGLFLPQSSELSMLVYAGETIYVNDATVNIVSIAK